MATYMVVDEHGNQICDGVQDVGAERVAQTWADRLGKAVWLTGADITDIRFDPAAPTNAHGRLVDYNTNADIRAATADEQSASREQAKRDGGAGVIDVDGRRCYVED